LCFCIKNSFFFFQDQIYELQALESIFSGTPECFSYHHQQQAPDPKITGSITIVLAKFDKEITIHADSKTVRISYLPPLFLYFTFPQDYPSCSMPKFSLRADWLDSNMNEGLSKILTNAWTDCCGMPPSLKAFIEYNEKAVQKDFEDDWYDCEVCYTSKSGKDCLKFLPCGHIFCSECTSEYYRQRMRENLLRHFGCLDDGCESVATQAQIRQVLTKKEYEVYEQRLLEGTLDLMSDVVICPRISCQAPSGIMFTVSLLILYIMQESLSRQLRDKLLDQFENATPAQLEDIYKRFGGREQVERQIQALKSEQWIASNSKACPSCRANIE
uniref:RING-type domain-containing protein n=1 Tax=Gongylonema pulchrum TaxID=637853 RepID=A0A183E084_9BILA